MSYVNYYSWHVVTDHFSYFYFVLRGCRIQRRPPTDSRQYALVIDGVSLSHVLRGCSGKRSYLISKSVFLLKPPPG